MRIHDDAVGDEAQSREFLHMTDYGGTPTLLQRVDRIDDILSSLEDKATTGGNSSRSSSSPGTGRSSGPPTPSSLEKRCKPAESVLEEVEMKGTLVERVALLETRVSKLDKSFQKIISSGSSEFVRPALVLSAPPSTAKEAHAHDVSSPEHLPVVQEKHEVLPTEHEQLPVPTQDAITELIMKGDHSQPVQEKGSEETERSQSFEQGPGSEGTSPVHTEESEKDAATQKSRKNKVKSFKKWLKKRLHVTSSHQPDSHQGMSVHCTHCWNLRRGVLHPSSEVPLTVDGEPLWMGPDHSYDQLH